jgi:hypothetical protein
MTYRKVKNNEFLINTGRVMGREPFATVDEIDLATGAIKIIWQATEAGYFPLFPTTLSSDDNFISFHFGGNDPWSDPGILNIIDRNGRSYGQRPNSVIVDWRSGGGPVVEEKVAEGQSQLLYWPLDGSAVQIFAELGSVAFEAGKWDKDGRFFIYSTVDEANNQSQLHLWKPDASQPTLLTTAEGSGGFQNFAWLPDGTAVYFNFGRTELWNFEVTPNALSLIASTDSGE